MTYLHDYLKARKTLQENVIPKMFAALMPTMDFLGYTYSREEDTLIVTLPDDILPDGYVMQVSFAPLKQSARIDKGKDF